ncbi:PorP/SprF family type IX secretion system membrane protein [Aurantibacillus circumpalustris]|uniref:PorP/SprF family type IX secretion system membrane protein n=1 Tax=Aurantibacillus circumpalustris TaxID=3036359 RepID=UPI00295AC351|nr:type IX secretion system membrane protein PorP/SprF [Aurantibacillus circumpalustris]
MKLLIRYILLTLPFLLTQVGSAQQDPMYSQYMFDKMLINPAFAGSSNWVVATLKYRNQFMGINGHPTTQTFNIHAPIQKKHIGVGLKIVNDKMSILSNLNVAAQLSYHLNFAGGKLSAGIEAGIYNKKINYQDLILSGRGDNAIPSISSSALVPDASFGIYYQKKQFYAGLSNYHLIKKSFNFNGAEASQAHLYKHFYFLVGNVFTLTKDITIEPSMLMKIQPSSSVQFDFNTLVYYKDRVGAGIQYRAGDAFVTMLRVNITESLRISYSYDLTVSKLSPYAKGAHELVISYGIKLPPPPTQKEIHPRYYF